MVDKRISLLNITSSIEEIPFDLKLNGATYKLTKLVGSGGSSLVYRGYHSKNNKPVIIKELYPKMIKEKSVDFYYRRKNNGIICINPDLSTEQREFAEKGHGGFNFYKEKIKREYDIIDKLLLCNDGKATDFRFFDSKLLIETNNTLYIVLETHHGDILSDLLDERNNGKSTDLSTFTEICECILRILEALKPVHDKGYLHLDIAPDNIHLMNQEYAIGGKRQAKLIDFNSAFNLKTDTINTFPFTYKEGYSAKELSHGKNMKPDELTKATDLFSVAAVFFYMLKKRPPHKKLDVSIKSRWEFTNESEYCGELSSVTLNLCNKIITKGIDRNSGARYQTICEFMSDVQELIDSIKAVTLVSNSSKVPYNHFVGRKDKLIEIDTILFDRDKHNYVFLEGIGGIGKSELAKKYAWENRGSFKNIQFINFRNNLISTIAFSLKFDNFDYIKNSEEYEEQEIKKIFEYKMRLLKNYGENTLIIVDNYDVEDDEHFEEFVSGDYKIIFTSREKHDGNVIEIDSMTEEELLELFDEYYFARIYSDLPSKIDEEDKPVLCNIIGLVLGHTMTVMLIASTMRVNETTPQDMYERLLKSFDPKLQKIVALKKEEIKFVERKQIMYHHILNLFNMERFADDSIQNEKCVFIMTNMAIVPYDGLEIKTFYSWALQNHYTSENLDDLMKLIRLRWIRHDVDDKEQIVSLHPVISDVANGSLKPDSYKCADLIFAYMSYTPPNDGKTSIEQTYYTANLMELACKRICDKTSLTAVMLQKFAQIKQLLLQNDVAIDYLNRVVTIFEDSLTSKKYPADDERFKLIRETKAALNTFVDEDKDSTIDFYNESISADEKLKNANQSYDKIGLANKYYFAALNYIQNEDDKDAVINLSKCIDMFLEIGMSHIGSDDLKTLSSAYMCRGEIFYKEDENDKSLDDYNKAVAIEETLMRKEVKMEIFDIMDVIRLYIGRARLLYYLDETEKAIADFITALRLNKTIFDGIPDAQEEYYSCLEELIDCLITESVDEKQFSEILQEFLYSLTHVEKTEESEEKQKALLKKVKGFID